MYVDTKGCIATEYDVIGMPGAVTPPENYTHTHTQKKKKHRVELFLLFVRVRHMWERERERELWHHRWKKKKDVARTETWNRHFEIHPLWSPVWNIYISGFLRHRICADSQPARQKITFAGGRNLKTSLHDLSTRPPAWNTAVVSSCCTSVGTRKLGLCSLEDTNTGKSCKNQVETTEELSLGLPSQSYDSIVFKIIAE